MGASTHWESVRDAVRDLKATDDPVALLGAHMHSQTHVAEAPAAPRSMHRANSDPSISPPKRPQRPQRAPVRGGLLSVANAAMDSKVQVDHYARLEADDDARERNHWFLPYKLMMREVERARGEHSWQCQLVHWLHSPLVSTALIVLLLIDVTVIFVELFLEGSYPACDLVRHEAVSCCAAPGDAAHHAAELLVDHPLHHAAELFVDHAARLLHADEHHADEHHGASHGASHGGGGACAEPWLVPMPANGVYCDPHEHSFVHQLETYFSLVTVTILGVFEAELLGLLLALDKLFFRSLLHIADLMVISASFGLQLYIYVVRTRAEAGGVGADGAVTLLPDDIQSLILFSRCWRFVRVGHGIATSINDILRARKQALHESVEEMREALALLEREISAHDKLVEKTMAERTLDQAGGPPPNGHSTPKASQSHAARRTSAQLPSLQHSSTGALQRAHKTLDRLAQQAAY